MESNFIIIVITSQTCPKHESSHELRHDFFPFPSARPSARPSVRPLPGRPKGFSHASSSRKRLARRALGSPLLSLPSRPVWRHLARTSGWLPLMADLVQIYRAALERRRCPPSGSIWAGNRATSTIDSALSVASGYCKQTNKIKSSSSLVELSPLTCSTGSARSCQSRARVWLAR